MQKYYSEPLTSALSLSLLNPLIITTLNYFLRVLSRGDNYIFLYRPTIIVNPLRRDKLRPADDWAPAV